jgi:inhibitor of cysteine peptidase
MDPAKSKKMFSPKRPAWFVWVLCFMLASGLASCRNHLLGERAGGSENMKLEKDKKVITPKGNGQAFEITVGETFQVSLPENPTTGYRWIVYGSGMPFVSLDKEDYVTPENDPARPILGGGGTKILTLKAAKPGETELSLRLRRSWEAESEFADSFSIKLKIVEP